MNAHTIELLEQPAEELARKPLSELKTLLNKFTEIADMAKSNIARVNLAVAERSGITNPNAPGTMTVMDPDSGKIKITVPKKVTWDQDELSKARDVIANDWAEDPSEYVTTTFKVDERKFSAWPSPIRAIFEAARTEDIGTPKYEILEV